jgi:hypothetical protein
LLQIRDDLLPRIPLSDILPKHPAVMNGAATPRRRISVDRKTECAGKNKIELLGNP